MRSVQLIWSRNGFHLHRPHEISHLRSNVFLPALYLTGPKVLFSFSIIQDQVLLSKSDGNLALRSTWPFIGLINFWNIATNLKASGATISDKSHRNCSSILEQHLLIVSLSLWHLPFPFLGTSGNDPEFIAVSDCHLKKNPYRVVVPILHEEPHTWVSSTVFSELSQEKR